MNKILFPTLIAALLTLSGCIVTERQIETEQSLGELNTLALKLDTESKSLKAAIEENSNMLAEIYADMDTLQQDFAVMRGGFETREHSLQKVEANFDLLSDAIAALDERMKDIDAITERLERVESPLRDDKAETGLDNALLELRISIEEIKKAAIEYQLKEKTQEQEEHTADKDQDDQGEKDTTEEDNGPGPQELYLEGLEAVKVDGEFAKGIETLRLFLSLYNDHELADNAQYWIAEAYYGDGKWERAALEFSYVAKNYPKADKVPAALLKQAFSFKKMGDKDTYTMILQKLIKDHPKSDEAKRAQEEIDNNKGKENKESTPANNAGTKKE